MFSWIKKKRNREKTNARLDSANKLAIAELLHEIKNLESELGSAESDEERTEIRAKIEHRKKAIEEISGKKLNREISKIDRMHKEAMHDLEKVDLAAKNLEKVSYSLPRRHRREAGGKKEDSAESERDRVVSNVSSKELKHVQDRMGIAANKTGTSEFMQVLKDEIVHSGQLNPCIAIGIYNPKTKRGYLIHQPHMLNINLSEEIETIGRVEGDLSEIKVVAAGNSLLSGEISNKESGVNREYVLDVLFSSLKKAGAPENSVQYRWLQDNFVGDLFVDCNESKIYFESHKEMFDEKGDPIYSDKSIDVF